MGRVADVLDAGKALAGFGLGFALIFGGLLTVSVVGGDHVSVAMGDGLLFVSVGGKLLSIVLGAVGIAAGTALVSWAEETRRSVTRNSDGAERTVPTPGSSRHG